MAKEKFGKGPKEWENQNVKAYQQAARKIYRAVLPAYRKIKLVKMCTEGERTETFFYMRTKSSQLGNGYIE